MNSKTINWGIIGVGDVCEKKSAPAYQKTDGFKLKSVMRRDLNKANDFAQRHGIEQFTDNADELINDTEIDAIYIATPPNNHLEYALKVVESGKICCVEKPMAVTFKECETMHHAFKEKNTPLFVAYYRRCLPRFLQIKTWIDLNEIGDVRHIHWSLSKSASSIDLSQNYNWRTDKDIALGGYFDDLASHGLDFFHFILGEFESVNGHITNQQQFYTAHDALSASWIHKNGVTGSAFWNFGSWKREDKVEIVGSKGSIVFSVFDDNPVQLITSKETISLNIEHPENIQLYHVQAMKKHLDGIEQHPSTGETALHTAWIMDKVLGRI
ncbi:MAG: Gfo/Idh/MocA family oxidoreductase [Flavobacteriales bacterium]|nr:Gfo/Idh/MocA family oxidoreductase [Flavobacteriales bacterium]PIV95183.1 MAG: oxidoreductase [Flavobacteriaceae bacterium CG17_big_fil_post_rev_8_21_14_2_50_33_15]PIY09417.1 MAG: oxidoreductase [Flavobacteriaceae bacterium CG_4_10_14_3_um_filter_33_47]PJB20480.1 MAG: oxidoreductase [Flavobacteriaceae bacterium CG_4_9_14_3_um_filter_33_16]NCP52336.1 Gfo/Idh/MocA family oxidoreductase [Flavobacteriales bacterium]